MLNARVHYQTKTLVGLEFLPVEEAQSYWQADASITYNSPSKKYSARAYAQNLFDETVKSFSTPLALSVPGSLYLTALRPPRTYGLRLGVSF
ncbi:MAG: TonB-dependent receptor [Ahniella sp.]|nr:TonB-dependent receptor [Ahniella sp.]